jgi:hypothetical protein
MRLEGLKCLKVTLHLIPFQQEQLLLMWHLFIQVQRQEIKYLRSNEFFDVEKYPTATYTIKEVKQEANAYTFIGDLTLMASTKELIVPFEIIKK